MAETQVLLKLPAGGPTGSRDYNFAELGFEDQEVANQISPGSSSAFDEAGGAALSNFEKERDWASDRVLRLLRDANAIINSTVSGLQRLISLSQPASSLPPYKAAVHSR